MAAFQGEFGINYQPILADSIPQEKEPVYWRIPDFGLRNP